MFLHPLTSRLSADVPRANEAAAVDLRGVSPSTRLPQAGRRSGFSVWTGDERLSTFAISAPGAPPRASELQRLKILDSRENRPAEGPVEAPKVGPHAFCRIAFARHKSYIWPSVFSWNLAKDSRESSTHPHAWREV